MQKREEHETLTDHFNSVAEKVAKANLEMIQEVILFNKSRCKKEVDEHGNRMKTAEAKIILLRDYILQKINTLFN